MYFRPYGQLSLDDIRRSETRILQLQAFMNELAPWYGQSPIDVTGTWNTLTSNLYGAILRYDGYTGEVYDGMSEEMVAAWGVGEITAQAWEWAILVARQRQGSPIVAAPRLASGTTRVLTPEEAGTDEEDEPAGEEKKNWPIYVAIGGVGAVAVIAIIIAATRRR